MYGWIIIFELYMFLIYKISIKIMDEFFNFSIKFLSKKIPLILIN
jgi:hypothetical protein